LFGDGKQNDQIAKLTATLNLAQKGTALVYYGEEIGMGDMDDKELNAAVIGPKRPRADNRDRERSPMHWEPTSDAGFSKAIPWLPVQTVTAKYNVIDQERDKNSILNWYRTLMKLRKENAAFSQGDYVAIDSGDKDVFAFARLTPKGEGAIIVLNCGADTKKLHLRGLPANAKWGELILANPVTAKMDSTQISVAPYGVVINQFTAK